MSALRPGQIKAQFASTGLAGTGLAGLRAAIDGFVLPRWLRWPVRVFGRMVGGHYEPPRFAATIASGAFLALSALYGAWLGGQMPSVVQSVTSRAGFAVDEVRVTGHRETSEIDILERLELDGWTSLVGFDAELARERIATLPWVKSASVRKVYPDALEVDVVERQPFALWQQGRELSIVDRAGAVIAPFGGGRHSMLPLVIGHGASERAAAFVDKVKQFPELAARVKGYIRVAERRWDLRMENGVTVKLPEGNEDAAIAELLRMDRESGLLSRDIASVDLRLADRLVVQLTPDAVTRREAALAASAKAARKKPGQKI